jgi:hypothetical protein
VAFVPARDANGLNRTSFANVVKGARMRDILLEIRISRGEPWRNIATAVWPAGGSLILGQPTERLPPELITALNRHQEEFGPTIGIWNYSAGDANYQVAFSHYDANEIN